MNDVRLLNKPEPSYVFILSGLMLLFLARVVGQALVAFFNVPFLPPMEEWFSGLLPYPELLTCQIVILILGSIICRQFATGRGFFVVPRAMLGRVLVNFGSVYLIVMIMRYAIRMTLYPAERWAGGSIPIFFHWVLAGFVLVCGIYHWKRSKPRNADGKITVISTACKYLWYSTVVLGVAAWTAWQVYPTVIAHQLGLRPAQYAVRVEERVPMLTSDGTKLVADIFHPQRLEKTPTILVRIPFTKSIKTTFYENLMGRIWSERGYTVVVQGTRGRYESGGTFYPLRGERQDGIDTLNWLSKQSWYNGKVGTWGGSAFGQTQWAISDQKAPGPSAMFIYEASSDFFEMFHPGGGFSLHTALSWAINSHGKKDRPDWPPVSDIMRGATGFPAIDSDLRAVGKIIPFFRDWAMHVHRDAYWTEIDGTQRASKVAAPIFFMAGWYDPFLPTQLRDYKSVTSNNPSVPVAQNTRLIIGPWTHAGEVTLPDGTEAPPFRANSLALSLQWFDELLNGFPPSDAVSSRVKIFVMGKNEWREENEWPLARAKYTSFYLHGSKRTPALKNLTTQLPKTPEPAIAFKYNPHDPVPTRGGAMIGKGSGIVLQDDPATRNDVLTFDTAALQQDVEATGPCKVILYVSTSAPSTDFSAKLVDVHPNGKAYNVCDGIRRLKFGANKTSKIEEISIDLWPTSIVFLKGHRIRLEISSSNFPRYDRNPNTERGAMEVSPATATQIVHQGIQSPSRLVLPIVK